MATEDKVIEIHGHKDNFLQVIVDMVNDEIITKSNITLQMGGFLISGTLIPGDVYFKKFADSFVKSLSNPDSSAAQTLHSYFDSYGDIYKKRREKEDEDNPAITTHIHMENCTIGDISSRSEFQVLWRGRISEVDGYFLGAITMPSKPK